MSKLVLSGDTSGSVTLDAPAVSGTTTLTLPTTSGTVLTNGTNSNFPSGSILQVVQGTYATQGSTTSTSYVTTNLTASITPSSSSNKVLVTVSLNGVQSPTSNYFWSTLYRNATDLAPTANGFGWSYGSANITGGNLTFSYLDSPSTTSSTSYTSYIKVVGGTCYWCVSGVIATIILQEVKS